MQAKRQIKIDLNCHWKYGKTILFHLLKQTLGVSELAGHHKQTLWARHCCSLIKINMTAIPLEGISQSPKLSVHLACPSQTLLELCPFLPKCSEQHSPPSNAFSLSVSPSSPVLNLSATFSLWSWPQAMSSRFKARAFAERALTQPGCPSREIRAQSHH